MRVNGLRIPATWLVILCGTAACVPTTASALPPPPKGADPVLKGPSVVDRRVPGVDNGFGSKPDGRYADRVPAPVYMRALESLRAADAKPELRLSPEQDEQLRAIEAEFRKSQREYMSQHRDELQELRAKAPGGRGEFAKQPQGKKADARQADDMTDMMAADPAAAAERQQATARLRQIEEGAPKPDDAFKRAFTILNPAQRAHVEAQLAAFKESQVKEAAERKAEREVRDRAAKSQTPAPNAKKPGKGKAADALAPVPPPPIPGSPSANRAAPRENAALGKGDREDRRQRLMEMWDRLAPEEQEMLLQKLRERAAERPGGAGPGGKRGPRNGGEPKPPPPPDSVRVPPPDEPSPR
ncbi:MAG: hypothetical protein JNM07_10265 [Phycisphaerae bacterium]|nr:hypothetical protein [Phycisphaerae bacterium]